MRRRTARLACVTCPAAGLHGTAREIGWGANEGDSQVRQSSHLAATRVLSRATSLATLERPAALAALLFLPLLLFGVYFVNGQHAKACETKGAKPGTHQTSPTGTFSRLTRDIIEDIEIHDTPSPRAPGPLPTNQVVGVCNVATDTLGVNSLDTFVSASFATRSYRLSTQAAPDTILSAWQIAGVMRYIRACGIPAIGLARTWHSRRDKQGTPGSCLQPINVTWKSY